MYGSLILSDFVCLYKLHLADIGISEQIDSVTMATPQQIPFKMTFALGIWKISAVITYFFRCIFLHQVWIIRLGRFKRADFFQFFQQNVSFKSFGMKTGFSDRILLLYKISSYIPYKSPTYIGVAFFALVPVVS